MLLVQHPVNVGLWHNTVKMGIFSLIGCQESFLTGIQYFTVDSEVLNLERYAYHKGLMDEQTFFELLTPP